jgi:Flp pilus assembly protein TadG
MQVTHFLRAAKATWRNQSGVAAIEFAFILPILVMLTFGGYEGWNMILAAQRLDRVAFSVADLASRLSNSATEGDVTNLLDGGLYISQPFDVKKDGRIILSAVDPGTGRKITWQRCLGTKTSIKSVMGIEGAPAKLTAIKRAPTVVDNAIFVTEVHYRYAPKLLGMITGPMDLSRVGVVPSRSTSPSIAGTIGTASPC